MKLLLTFFRFFLLLTLAFHATADIEDVRIWQDPEKTRLVLDLTQAHEYKAFELNNPPRIVLDIDRAQLLKPINNLELDKTPISAIRSAERPNKELRLVLDLKQSVKPPVTFLLAPNEMYGHRLVVDLFPEAGKQTLKSSAPTAVKQADQYTGKKRDLIIAIDAGHGGEDPGAIGPGRIMEKHIVLAIAKELQRLLHKTPGYQPVMVRDGDYYLGLRERTQKARQAKADFFVSIHADAFKIASASGSSVFILSQRGASSETSAWLADKENRSDLIGGYKLAEENEQLNHVLLDLSMTNKQRESRLLGQLILKEMGKVTKLHKRQVEEAGFMVLKAPDIPALLVETGFISNPQEAKQLAGKAYQQKIAAAIHKGIVAYFSTHHPEGMDSPALSKTPVAPKVHVVVAGENLSSIAKRYGVKLTDLRQANRLTRETLWVGQRLQIPQ